MIADWRRSVNTFVANLVRPVDACVCSVSADLDGAAEVFVIAVQPRAELLFGGPLAGYFRDEVFEPVGALAVTHGEDAEVGGVLAGGGVVRGRFHTSMVHPTPLPVNPQPSDVGNLTPLNRQRIAPCAAESAAVDCRTPRIPLSIPHLAVDSAA
jgi:hypothetical protein